MNYDNKPNGYFFDPRPEMLKYLPQKFETVLDVGCGNGAFAKTIKDKHKCHIWGVEYIESEASIAAKKIDRVFPGSIEANIDNLPNHYFDVIYFNDVLEHLVDPYMILVNIKMKLKKNGIIISSLPNVRYHNTFKEVVVNKDWRYRDAGVMDRTHLRFFTRKSIKRMYEELGFSIIKHEGINKSRSLKPILYNIPVFFTHMDIFYPQFATVVQPK